MTLPGPAPIREYPPETVLPMTALLSLADISKRYGDILANDAISMSLRPGEIHALLGENGAGKSTLVKLLCGLVQPDSGTIRWRGVSVHIASPAAARAMGIGVVFQHFSLFEAMTVAENVALGLDRRAADAALVADLERLSDRYGLSLRPMARIAELSVGERQRVEIVRALMQDPALLILDEPTSVLTPQEADGLAATLRQLAGEGRSILYISHKLSEIRALCDRATVLRNGRIVGETDPKTASNEQLAELMVGARLHEPHRTAPLSADAPVRLEIRNLSQAPNPYSPTGLHDVSLSVRAGEIMGIAGVSGNGQNALLAALSGEVAAPEAGMIRLDGSDIGWTPSQARRAMGLAYVPPERLGTGAVPDLDLTDNALLSGYRRLVLALYGIIRPGKAGGFAREVVERFDVRTSGISARAGSLSGGNLQKFIVGREILQQPRLLVAAHPTWGVDAGAGVAIHQALLDLARTGASVLIVSEDLDELLVLADRIAVLCAGRLSRPVDTARADPATLGLLMAGEAHDAAA